VERERAIVTATPGTTRDLVSETVAIGGIPVKLVDTAGIRHALDEAESIGVRKSMEAMADADLVLVVLEAGAAVGKEDRELLEQVQNRAAIVVENKEDLAGSQFSVLSSQLAQVRTSALIGSGIDQLRSEIIQQIGGDSIGRGEAGFLTNVRHQGLVRDSLSALTAAEAAVTNKIPHEMILMDLYNVLRALDEITGATTNDDILHVIFSTFCIGK
jgi:tRNA modification GTPase